MTSSRTILTALLTLGLATSACGDNDLEIGPRNRSSAALMSFGSCGELHSALRDNLKEEMRVQLLQQLDDDNGWGFGGMADRTMAAGAESAPSAAGRQEGVDYSGTNNQEAGVDESDFVKTDGYYIYMVNGDRLEILGVPQFGELNHVSSTTLEGWPSQLLIADDRAIVFSYVSAWNLDAGHPLANVVGREDADWGWWYRVPGFTKLTVFDLTNRSAPSVMRELYVEGSFQTAREIDSAVRMVNYSTIDVFGLEYWVDVEDGGLGPLDPGRRERLEDAIRAGIRRNNRVINRAPLSDFLPQIYELDGSALVEHPFTRNDCQQFSISEDGTSRGFTSILTMNLLDSDLRFDDDHILTNQPMVYASTDTLIIAEPSNDWWWYWRNDRFDEASNLHRFDISAVDTTTYSGSGRADGTILNQFSISEHEGDVRVATTTGQWNRWWMEDPDPSENHITVLSGVSKLNVIGHVGGIAPGEQIWSARFDGDKAYMVTFRQIDPLWTIDLSNPNDPRVIGELEVPGVSTYIHPIENDKLLTVGWGGSNNGLDWTINVSLFDVADYANPATADRENLSAPTNDGWSSGWSEALHEHKAFQYWAPLGLLAIPVSGYRWGNNWYEYSSRLEIIRVDPAGSLTRYGAIDHSDFYNSDNQSWWLWTDVRRSIFMGDFIYAISDRGVTAHRLSDLSTTASVGLEGTTSDGFMY